MSTLGDQPSRRELDNDADAEASRAADSLLGEQPQALKKRAHLLQALRERDKPLLATPSAHGPG
jgi:hypothetical protein